MSLLMVKMLSGFPLPTKWSLNSLKRQKCSSHTGFNTPLYSFYSISLFFPIWFAKLPKYLNYSASLKQQNTFIISCFWVFNSLCQKWPSYIPTYPEQSTYNQLQMTSPSWFNWSFSLYLHRVCFLCLYNTL